MWNETHVQASCSLNCQSRSYTKVILPFLRTCLTYILLYPWQWSPQQFKEYSNLRSLIRYHALKAELQNTEAELQIMRPMGKGGGNLPQGKTAFVKNGLNPDKWFLQVHYLKVRLGVRWGQGRGKSTPGQDSICQEWLEPDKWFLQVHYLKVKICG